MKKILFYILGFASALLIAAGIAKAGTVIYPYQGGTGLSTSTSGNVGYNLYLKSVNASGTITAYGFQANGTSTGGGSTTLIYAGNAFLTVQQSGTNATLTPVSVLSLQSSTDISFGSATGTNIQATFLNPKGFTTTTIQSVLNSLSALGCLTYNSSTGVFNATCVATDTGNWQGTWQLFTPSDFLSSSTNLAPSTTIPVTYIKTFNGASGTYNLYVAGTGLTIATGTPSTTITWTNPGYITTSTNNFGGLTNASITATLPITWSAGSVIACPTCGDVNGTGTANYIPVWKGTTNLGTSSIKFDGVSTTVVGSTTITGYFAATGGDAKGNSIVGGNSFLQLAPGVNDGNVYLNMEDTGISWYASTTGSNGLFLNVSPGLSSFQAVLRTDNLTAANRIFQFPDAAGTFDLGTGKAGDFASWVNTSTIGDSGASSSTFLTGNQTITLSGAVTGSGATTIATTFTTSTLYGLFSGTSPITFNTSTGAIACPTCLTAAVTSINGDTTAAQHITVSGGLLTSSTVSGVTTIGLTSSAVAPSSTIYGAGAYLGTSGSNLTVSSTLASSTWGSFSVVSSTGWSVPVKTPSNVKRTLTYFACDDDTGTSTVSLTRYDALATTTVATNILVNFPCGKAGNSTTSFTSSTIPSGSFLGVTSTVAGTPFITDGYLYSTKL